MQIYIKNRPRCSPTGGFLCSFKINPHKTPHPQPFPVHFASLLGVTRHVSGSDANDFHDNGVYEITMGTNIPINYALLEVLNYSGLECVQNCYDILSGESYRRMYVNNAWTNWGKTFSLT